MKIYSHNTEMFITLHLLKYFDIKSISKPAILAKLAQKGDIALMGHWGEESIMAFHTLKEKEVITFPDPDFALKFINRKIATQELDKSSKFKVQRLYYDSDFEVPNLSSEFTVIKVGNEHVGKNKFRLKPGEKFIHTGENIIVEPFVKGRSIRVLIVGDYHLVIEHYKHPFNLRYPKENDWIMNIGKTIEVFPKDVPTEIIDDAFNISKSIQYDFVGIDYVFNEEQIVPLEINIMPGCPDNDEAVNQFKEYYVKKIKEMTNIF